MTHAHRSKNAWTSAAEEFVDIDKFAGGVGLLSRLRPAIMISNIRTNRDDASPKLRWKIMNNEIKNKNKKIRNWIKENNW